MVRVRVRVRVRVSIAVEASAVAIEYLPKAVAASPLARVCPPVERECWPEADLPSTAVGVAGTGHLPRKCSGASC